MQSCREGTLLRASKSSGRLRKKKVPLQAFRMAKTKRQPATAITPTNLKRIGRSVFAVVAIANYVAKGPTVTLALCLCHVLDASHFPNSLSQRPARAHTQRPRLNDLRTHPGKHSAPRARTAKGEHPWPAGWQIHGQMAHRTARRHRRTPIPKTAIVLPLLFPVFPDSHVEGGMQLGSNSAVSLCGQLCALP